MKVSTSSFTVSRCRRLHKLVVAGVTSDWVQISKVHDSHFAEHLAPARRSGASPGGSVLFCRNDGDGDACAR